MRAETCRWRREREEGGGELLAVRMKESPFVAAHVRCPYTACNRGTPNEQFFDDELLRPSNGCCSSANGRDDAERFALTVSHLLKSSEEGVPHARCPQSAEKSPLAEHCRGGGAGEGEEEWGEGGGGRGSGRK